MLRKSDYEQVINWEQYPHRLERAAQMLLKRLNPDLRSLDGAGGDGGRDAQWVDDQGTTVFEVKSFGRLTQSRRRQIQKSLLRAVESVPEMTRWVLVIPLNMTPSRPGAQSSEEAWFEGTLARLAPGVHLEWWGQDWLDEQIATAPDVQRYIEGPDAQLLARAKEFNLERAALANGLADLEGRNAGLRNLVDEVSPYWTLDWSVRDGVHISVLRAKQPDAATVDPITLTPTISFKTADPDAMALRGHLERTLRFGGRVSLPPGYVSELRVDASPEARLLLPDSDPSNDEFTFISKREKIERPLRCFLQVVEAASGDVVAALDVHFRERTAGSVGVTLYGADAPEVIAVTARLPSPSLSSDGRLPDNGEVIEAIGAGLDFAFPDDLAGYDIDALLPVLRLLRAARPGRMVRLEMPGLGHISGHELTETQFPEAHELCPLVEDLQRMQAHTGQLLRMPANITDSDARDLRTAVRLLDDEDVEIDERVWRLGVYPDKLTEFLEVFPVTSDGLLEGGLLFARQDMELTVGDLTLSYGPAARWAPRPRLRNREQLVTIAGQIGQRNAEDAPEVFAEFEVVEHPFLWVKRSLAESYF